MVSSREDQQSPATDEVASDSSKDGAIRTGALAGRSLPAAMLILALPVLLQQFATAFVHLIDRILTGDLPDGIARPALDGVTIASYLSWFIGVCMAAIGVGGMALIARAIGAGNRPLAERALGQCFIFGTLWGGVIGLVIYLGVPWLARISNLSPDGYRYCLEYSYVMAAGMPISACLIISMNCLQGAGETLRPFLITIVVNIVNVFVSWFLSGVDIQIFDLRLENPFSIDWHVIGIALGTVIGQLVGCVLIIALMIRGIEGVSLTWTGIKPHFDTLRRIVRVGIPSFFDGLGMWMGNLIAVFVLIGEIVKRTGTDEGLLGAHMIAVQWEAFSFMPGFAMGVAAGTLAGQFLGAGNPKMAARSILACAGVGVVLMGGAGLLFIFAGKTLTRVISEDAVHLELAPQLLFLCGLVQVGFALAMVIRGGLRGVGDTTASMVITWVSTYGVRIPLCWFFGLYLDMGLVGIWIGLSAELAIRGLLFLGRFLQGRWKLVDV